MILDFEFIIRTFPKVLGAVPNTLFLTITACFGALIIGLIMALLIIFKVPVGKQFAMLYVSYIRGTPLVVMLYIIYSLIPMLVGNMFGKEVANGIPPMIYAVVAFAINQSAFFSEMYRSALESVDRGQMEAALSIGMSGTQAMFKVVLPQAAVVAIPNFTNIFLLLIKGTSLAFTVTVVDIMGQAKLEAANGLRHLEAYVIAAVIYWLICMFFETVLSKVETRLSYYLG